MKKIIYKPYSRYKIEVYIESLLMAFLGWIFIEGLVQEGYKAIFFSGAYIVCLMLCIKNTLSRIMLVICLEEKGIHIINGERKSDQFVFWEDLSYGYYCVNYRNTPYLVLTAKEMNSKKIKKLVRSSSNKQFADENIVIRLFAVRKEDEKQIVKIKELVSNKVLNIREYKQFD